MKRPFDRTHQNPEPTDEYEVGYGKPPREHQFKPGRSGNPRGRPKKKGLQDMDTIIGSELARPIAIIENGRSKILTAGEIIGRGLVNDAAKGSPSARKLLLSRPRLRGEPSPTPSSSAFPAGAAERLIGLLDRIAERRKSQEAGPHDVRSGDHEREGS
ncbi:MAG: hypothetical protein IT535_07425 [Bauldia sp.]|nr:hypothetical protein [Bauldia sp.]